ncbi:30S ribosomal protein S7 [Candidatus Bathyarchaeota archaeon]|nr:30S ribosomal protein S7 [Candidatus Bathyarchaeota archaeon]
MDGPAEREEIKLFGEWSFKDVKVRDLGLERYICLDPVYIPHSGGRHESKRFRKSRVNIVERLVNNLMRPGKSGGEKMRAINVVRNAFKIVELKTGRNPIEVLVRAVENAAPCEDTTRIGYGGIVYRLAVDISPQRRVDLALRFLVQGAKQEAFSNRKTLEEALANQLIGAASNDGNIFAIRRRQEIERIALASR